MSRPRLTYANVVSTLALGLAVTGGTAYAAATIGSSNIKTGAVTSTKIASDAVTSAKVKAGSLRASDFAASSLPKGDTGATGATGPTGPTGPAGASATALGGVINSFGGIVVNKGILAVSNQSAGVYLVSFNRNVQQCVVTGNVGGFYIGGNSHGPLSGTLVINGTGDTSPESVTIITRDSGGVNTNLPFHLIASC